MARIFVGVPAGVKRNFLADLTSASCYGIFLSFVVNFVPVIARRLGADPFLLAMLMAAPFASNVILFCISALIPSGERTRLVATLFALARGLFLLAYLVVSPVALVALALVFYLVQSAPLMLVAGLFRQMYPRHIRGQLLGYVRVGLAATATVAALVGGWLLDSIGYRLLLPIGALFGIATGICWLFVRVESDAEESRFTPVSALRRVLSSQLMVTYTTGWFIWGFGAFMVLPRYPIYLVDHLQASYAEVGALNFITSVCWLVAFFVLGKQVDRHGGVSTLAFTFILGSIVPLIYVFEPGLAPVAVAFAITGVVNAGIELGWLSSMMELSPPGRVSESVATVNGIAGVRGLIVPFVGAALAQVPGIGLTGTFVIATSIAFVGAAIMIVTSRRARLLPTVRAA